MLKLLFWPFRAVMRILILAFDRLWVPKAQLRAPERQAAIDTETQALSLYHFEACPFCVKVRRHARRLGLKLEMKDVRRSAEAEKELLAGGGQMQVPCLRIQGGGPAGADRWMYESSDINQYLSERFGA